MGLGHVAARHFLGGLDGFQLRTGPKTKARPARRQTRTAILANGRAGTDARQLAGSRNLGLRDGAFLFRLGSRHGQGLGGRGTDGQGFKAPHAVQRMHRHGVQLGQRRALHLGTCSQCGADLGQLLADHVQVRHIRHATLHPLGHDISEMLHVAQGGLVQTVGLAALRGCQIEIKARSRPIIGVLGQRHRGNFHIRLGKGAFALFAAIVIDHLIHNDLRNDITQ
mmetsp:Transcript_23308/g.40452  ORF Transcript_23308/g.40452 Transcript_23308/m.40452 type:complete len:224 (-) Transcript_23308:5081-5752(-)